MTCKCGHLKTDHAHEEWHCLKCLCGFYEEEPMKPEHLLALRNICESQEQLQAAWDNPAVYNFTKKYQAWVSMCVANDGGEVGTQDKLKWTAAIRLANPIKRNFKSVALWTVLERIKARTILLDTLADVGQVLGEEEFATAKGLYLCKKLTPEEKGIILAPHILGTN